MWDDWYRNTKAGEMTPTEFEQYCKEILERFAQKENLQDFVILHDVHLESNDGNYQIDVFAEFRALGVSFKVLCECKQYKNRVSREKVAVEDIIAKHQTGTVIANKLLTNDECLGQTIG